uniref:Uncharacterized protein n=1 Tax=Knipowitschia caucasica TaxID=637954 RepID=A0AAV2LNR9_KNICA
MTRHSPGAAQGLVQMRESRTRSFVHNMRALDDGDKYPDDDTSPSESRVSCTEKEENVDITPRPPSHRITAIIDHYMD